MTPSSPPASGGAGFASALGLVAVLAVGTMVALQPRPPAPESGAIAAPCEIPGGGYLLGTLYGDLPLRLNFRNAQLHCEGMLRPDEGGLRLMFAGIPPGSSGRERLVLVLGIDGQLAGLAGRERFANVTLIDERDGRFFNARGPGRCLTTVRSAEPLPDTGDRWWRIEGELYCAGALPSLQDMASVTLGTLRYAGRLDVESL